MRSYVGVGSNLGDRRAHLAAAVRHLSAGGEVAVLRRSRIWETAPVGPPQPAYLNGVLELESSLSAQLLLRRLLDAEAAEGRVRAERWGARTLDLDLLLHGEEVIDVPGLQVPHPGLAGRRFALVPLAELAPGLAVPGTGRRVAELLAAAPPMEMVEAGEYPREG